MKKVLHSDERRREILRILTEKTMPVSASVFAEKFGVTRQIIVKDIALLRAEKKDIISTAKGYILNKNDSYGCRTTVYVCHDAEHMEDELTTIVDLGGKVLTTAVEHPFYGTLGETLNIKSRKDIKNFFDRLKKTKSEPLLKLTQGKHIHIIEADDEESLQEICDALKEKGYISEH